MMSDPDSPAANAEGKGPDPLRLTETAPLGDSSAPPQLAESLRPPECIGRYRVESLLGRGGFGLVYLAHDDQLHRPVAVKVPHVRLVPRPEDAELYMTEARTVANLDHPHIVPVYDVGSTSEFPVYFVCKYIDGIDLATKLQQTRLSVAKAVELVAIVAEALHSAHKQGLVHRDIKPGNILLDNSGKPFVADFGVALREGDKGIGLKYGGTPAYMSPEQARGEGHRVDGRSDIFSLGIVLYELLAGRRPFTAESKAELFDQIITLEPRPPRQMDDTIPQELERICLKALAKRATERYSTAKDFADDLRHFLAVSSCEVSATSPRTETLGATAVRLPADASPATAALDRYPLRIIPKGLRSFDAEDADFFLELLPGPRDRDGLPDSIRFWKTRIEETDPDSTFAVGLIYGPSGCGKSSLVKAALLPRLSRDVVSVYVEATAGETETRLLRGLRKRCPDLPDSLTLKETLSALRRGEGVPTGKKVLIVLDQFEQWLHANEAREETELVHALRQCDGGRVKCIVMVRDDFWLAVSRFMHALEVRLLEGHNSALVDLFDTQHACKVLAAYGRAYGRLPENAVEMNQEHRAFLKRAVQDLAEDGKVICVRLALLAEMLKGKAWTPATLKEVGGTAGVGVTFLEETFSASTAPPEHRYHQKAARAVLQALLSESGTQIRGLMRSRDELLEASAVRPNDFDDLIRILDGELRLITPTDPEGAETAGDSTSQARTGKHYYQLTHDYLVPSLRDWLTRKQRETRRGRAELRLADLAATWSAKPENRNLPALWEYLNIRLFADRRRWTESQRKMMGKAGRVHGVRSVSVVIMLGTLIVAALIVARRINEQREADYATALVHALLAADTADAGRLVRELGPYRRWVDPILADALNKSGPESKQRLHASLALSGADPGQLGYLCDRLLSARAEDVAVIGGFMAPHKASLLDRLWAAVERPVSRGQRLRAAGALAILVPDDRRWATVAADVVTELVSVPPVELKAWINNLRPVGNQLADALRRVFADRRPERAEERPLAAATLADYFADNPQRLSECCLLADNNREFRPLLEKLRPHREEALSLLGKLLAKSVPPGSDEEARDALWKSQANAAVCLLELGSAERVWPLLKHSPDPSLRSYLVHCFGELGASVQPLIERVGRETDGSVRRAVILSLGEYRDFSLSVKERHSVVEELATLYRNDPDAGIHGAAAWTLRQWQEQDRLQQIDKELQQAISKEPARIHQRNWYINFLGQTFTMVKGPVAFVAGDKAKDTEPRKMTLAQSFAIATQEVTIEQFKAFRRDYKSFEREVDAQHPASGVTWYDAAAFCNWLSQREGLPREEWCYEPNEKGEYAEGMKIPANCLQRLGYRLPIETEWEYACRANSTATFAFGDSEALLTRYAWWGEHSGSGYSTGPVGKTKPNDLGIFDMYGNVSEWCHNQQNAEIAGATQPPEVVRDKQYRVLSGFSCADVPWYASSLFGGRYQPSYRFQNIGFRPARTCR